MVHQPAGDQPPAFSFPGGQPYPGQQSQSGRNFSRPAGGGTAIERPQQVETAFRLLVSFIALGVIAAVLNFVAGRMDIDHVVDISLARSGLTPTELERDLTYQAIGIALIVIFLVVPAILYALGLLLSFVMRRGRNWARILLTIASAVFLLYTVVSIDGVATFMSSGAVGFAFGLMWIAQLPLLIGALWLLFRPAANQYFRKPRV